MSKLVATLDSRTLANLGHFFFSFFFFSALCFIQSIHETPSEQIHTAGSGVVGCIATFNKQGLGRWRR